MGLTITIVGKGPSAINAQAWIDAEATDVAVINEAGLLLRSTQAIDYAFFSHLDFVELSRPTWGRTLHFSGPAYFKVNGRIERQFPDQLPVDFPREKYDGYVDHACCGDEQSLVDRIVAGGISHHHTATGAHHWLAKRGYRRIRVIGVDGGSQYATGMSGHVGPWSLDEWKVVHKRLADVLHRIYGTTTEWYQ